MDRRVGERVLAGARDDEFVARELRVTFPLQTEAAKIPTVMDGICSRRLDAEVRGEARDMGALDIAVGTVRKQCQIRNADGRGELLRRAGMGLIVKLHALWIIFWQLQALRRPMLWRDYSGAAVCGAMRG